MANSDTPSGFRPVAHVGGGTPQRMSRYHIASAYGTSIFSGDPVLLVGGGNSTNRRINVADGTAAIVGIFAGCEYTAADGSFVYSKHWLASTVTKGSADAVAYVYDDPNMVFEVQDSGVLALTSVGHLCDLAYTAGSTATGMSKAEITSTAGTNDIFYIWDVVDRPDNEVGSANAKALVMINKHQYVNGGASRFVEST